MRQNAKATERLAKVKLQTWTLRARCEADFRLPPSLTALFAHTYP